LDSLSLTEALVGDVVLRTTEFRLIRTLSPAGLVAGSLDGPTVGDLGGLPLEPSRLIRTLVGSLSLIEALVGDVVLRTTEFRLIRTLSPAGLVAGSLDGPTVGDLGGLPLDPSRLIRTLLVSLSLIEALVGDVVLRTTEFRLIRTLSPAGLVAGSLDGPTVGDLGGLPLEPSRLIRPLLDSLSLIEALVGDVVLRTTEFRLIRRLSPAGLVAGSLVGPTVGDLGGLPLEPSRLIRTLLDSLSLIEALVGDAVLRTTEFRLIRTLSPAGLVAGSLVGPTVGDLGGLPLDPSRLIRTLLVSLSLIEALVGDVVLRTTEFRLIRRLPPAGLVAGSLVGPTVGDLGGLPTEPSKLIRPLLDSLSLIEALVGDVVLRTTEFRLIRRLPPAGLVAGSLVGPTVGDLGGLPLDPSRLIRTLVGSLSLIEALVGDVVL
jgi:hypothetical protein